MVRLLIGFAALALCASAHAEDGIDAVNRMQQEREMEARIADNQRQAEDSARFYQSLQPQPQVQYVPVYPARSYDPLSAGRSY